MIEKGYDSELIDLIISRIYQNQFKRKPPIIAKLTSRTIGHDFLYPRDIKL
jgi:NAD+ synthase